AVEDAVILEIDENGQLTPAPACRSDRVRDRASRPQEQASLRSEAPQPCWPSADCSSFPLRCEECREVSGPRHCANRLPPLVCPARLSPIPRGPSADWRSLPPVPARAPQGGGR